MTLSTWYCSKSGRFVYKGHAEFFESSQSLGRRMGNGEIVALLDGSVFVSASSMLK